MVKGLLFTALAVAATPFAAGQSTCTTTTSISLFPTAPASDPFWKAPADLNTRAQGSVFNCRQVNWKQVNGARAYYQYAYKTVRKDGVSAVGVATLLLPNNTATTFNKLLAYQVPYDAPTSFCGMSYVYQIGAPVSTANTYGISPGDVDQSPTQALAAGIPVVISDYETNFGSFTVGLTSGYATINGIRAVIKSSGFFPKNPAVALWGYSGGALASEFALELAGTQATDLNIIGAAIGGLTPITRNTAQLVNGPHTTDLGLQNALVPYGLLGVANENSTVNTWVQANLKTTIQLGSPDLRTYKARFNAARSDACDLLTAPTYANQDFNTWFNGLPTSGQVLDVPIVSDALNVYGIMGQTGSAGRTTPKVPVFVYKGTLDEISAVRDTTELVSKYCGANNAGARISYVEYVGQDHGGAALQGFAPAWRYLKARFDGTPVASGCATSLVASSSVAPPAGVVATAVPASMVAAVPTTLVTAVARATGV